MPIRAEKRLRDAYAACLEITGFIEYRSLTII